jgi:hypothetical protein
MDVAPIPARENDSSCPERRHSTVDRAAKALGQRRSGKLHRRAFEARHQPGHRIVRTRSPEAGKSSAEIAGNAQIPACSTGVAAAGRRTASAESRWVTELHLWVVRRPLIGEAAENPPAGIAEIPACSAGVPAVAGRRHASAESRRVTELYLWVAWRPLIQEAAANPVAGIAQIPRGP